MLEHPGGGGDGEPRRHSIIPVLKADNKAKSRGRGRRGVIFSFREAESLISGEKSLN